MADQMTAASMQTPLPTPTDDVADTLVALGGLREDPDPAVRRDVAETLEALARTQPTLVLATVQRWLAEGGPHTTAVVRTARCARLARSGDDGARRLLGLRAGGGGPRPRRRARVRPRAPGRDAAVPGPPRVGRDANGSRCRSTPPSTGRARSS